MGARSPGSPSDETYRWLLRRPAARRQILSLSGGDFAEDYLSSRSDDRQHVLQCLRLERLAQVSIEAKAKKSFAIALERVCGERDDRRMVRVESFTDDPGRFNTAHLGHLN